MSYVVPANPQSNQQIYVKVNVMKNKIISKSPATRAAQPYEAGSEVATSSNQYQRARTVTDKDFMLVLGKFLVWRQDYELVVSRFEAMYDTLVEGVEYLPQDLVCGDQICDPWGVPVGELETLLCLKHMAALPNAKIEETRFDRFALTANA